MMDSFTQKRERGIAMLVVMFALLLLSVVGLGMMYSTNMETAINSNYRDKQVTLYAALGGLQEARDRIQPATANIVAPDVLPTTAAAKVIYIVSNYASVKPWDTSNPYFDTELCQEHVLGLTGTPGVPCTTMASGTSWFSYVDDSQSSSAPWNLASPLDLKWTRITLKGNNMTPVPVNGNSASADQACWGGVNQMSTPTGYSTGCMPTGPVTTITLDNPGSGYTSTPTVTLGPPPAGGIQATATALTTTITSGYVDSITLTTGGTSYSAPVTVTLSGGGGSGATATATLGNGGSPVTSVVLDTAGTKCYSAGAPPTVNINPVGGGSGASATAVLAGTPSCVYDWTLSGNCSAQFNAVRGYSPIDQKAGVTFAAGNASFTGTLYVQAANDKTVLSHPACCTITTPGTGYTANFTSNLTWPDCSNLTTTVTVGYRVASVNLTSGGDGYMSAPTISFGGGGVGTAASAPTAHATVGAVTGPAGTIIGLTLTSGGSGYTGTPAVVIAGTNGTGTGAIGVAHITTSTSLVITGFTITNGGSKYASNPAVTISGGGGSGATATATISGGTKFGQVYLLTSLAQSRTGARTMAQMEVASPILGYASGAALVLDGPNPSIGSMPNSNPFMITGADANSCLETPDAIHPAIDGYDDPNASPVTHSVQTIVDSLPRPDHYTGAGGTPSVENGYASLGETMTTPIGLKALIDAIRVAPGRNLYGNDPGSIAFGTPTHTVIDYVEGDLTLNGNGSGYGILVVSGTLHMGGDFSWHGPVFVVGDGIADFNGGGNGQIVGSVIIAKIWDGYATKNLLNSLGSPAVSWNGGGGNGISYDHCWATNLMNSVPFTPPPSTQPLRVLSFRILPY